MEAAWLSAGAVVLAAAIGGYVTVAVRRMDRSQADSQQKQDAGLRLLDQFHDELERVNADRVRQDGLIDGLREKVNECELRDHEKQLKLASQQVVIEGLRARDHDKDHQLILLREEIIDLRRLIPGSTAQDLKPEGGLH